MYEHWRLQLQRHPSNIQEENILVTSLKEVFHLQCVLLIAYKILLTFEVASFDFELCFLIPSSLDSFPVDEVGEVKTTP